jgi:hypothetical protein
VTQKGIKKDALELLETTNASTGLLAKGILSRIRNIEKIDEMSPAARTIFLRNTKETFIPFCEREGNKIQGSSRDAIRFLVCHLKEVLSMCE